MHGPWQQVDTSMFTQTTCLLEEMQDKYLQVL
jgi:hypothetical protein